MKYIELVDLYEAIGARTKRLEILKSSIDQKAMERFWCLFMTPKRIF
ncbi:MAG: hypothetical protein QSU88_12545 [Candidatus Methanoperedens sp.]|nr:hypothetical protein [Candidatus Methanoperedens sp.]